MLWAICYDISTTTRRRQVGKVLEGYGKRVQRSVFECRLSADDFAAVQQRVGRLGLEDGDLVRYYPFCQACVRRIAYRGGAPPAAEATDLIL